MKRIGTADKEDDAGHIAIWIAKRVAAAQITSAPGLSFRACIPGRCRRSNPALRGPRPPPDPEKIRSGSCLAIANARSRACGSARSFAQPCSSHSWMGRLLQHLDRPASLGPDRPRSFLRHQHQYRSCRDESLGPLARSRAVSTVRDSGMQRLRLVHLFCGLRTSPAQDCQLPAPFSCRGCIQFVGGILLAAEVLHTAGKDS